MSLTNTGLLAVKKKKKKRAMDGWVPGMESKKLG